MRIFIYLLTLILVVLFGFQSQASTITNLTIGDLQNIEYLYAICSGYNKENPTYFKLDKKNPEKNCHCCCAESEWICVENGDCPKDGDKCQSND